MKKAILFIFSTLICLHGVFADNIVVNNVSIPQGGKAVIKISLVNTENIYTAGQMALQLPAGISAVMDENGVPVVEKGERLMSTNHTLGSSHLSNGMEQFTIFSISSEAISAVEGALLNVMISANEELEVGDVLEGNLMNVEMTTTDAVPTPFNDISFSITIVEPVDPWITLDENSPILPEASNGEVQIKVKRTLEANCWSAICLPFAMTKEQMYDVFGEDVQLAMFDYYYTNEDLSVINIVFSDAGLEEYGFLANYPYIIKTSKDITEFIVTSTIEPNEEEAVVEYSEGRGPSKKVYGTFYGTLKAVESVPNNSLLLSDSTFSYSTGATQIKGFCGYFDFVDLLANPNDASSNICLIVPDEVTGIDNIIEDDNGEDVWYTLHGVRIDNPTSKGIYIKNGKKVYVK